jgi:hypothetical protein
MYLVSRKPPSSGALPLQGAVLCVNCECVSNGRLDECPVCGSRSLLNIGQMLGGTPLSEQPADVAADHNAVRFDLTITIELKQLDSKDVNTALERITRLIGPRLGQGRAYLHANVEPLAALPGANGRKAA